MFSFFEGDFEGWPYQPRTPEMLMRKKSKSHRRKGLVVVRTKDHRLRLRLPRSTSPDGKQKDICLGLPDTPENRERAEDTALEIELDIRKGQFDSNDLKKYGITRKKQSQAKVTSESKVFSLHDLYERYIFSKKSSVRPGTWKNGYLVTLSHISRSPFATLEINSIDKSIAYKICDWAIDNLTPDSGRRFMTQLNACFVWALERRLITSNESKSPFDGLASNVRKTFCRFNSKKDIESFSANERDLIIEAFRQSERYQCYAPYVEFCFFTGCRPSEAVALDWSDIATDLSRITFRKVLLNGEGGEKEYHGLKTQKQRTFPCNEQVKNILEKAKSQHLHSDIVFPNKSGNRLTVRHFHNKPWKLVMATLPI